MRTPAGRPLRASSPYRSFGARLGIHINGARNGLSPAARCACIGDSTVEEWRAPVDRPTASGGRTASLPVWARALGTTLVLTAVAVGLYGIVSMGIAGFVTGNPGHPYRRDTANLFLEGFAFVILAFLLGFGGWGVLRGHRVGWTLGVSAALATVVSGASLLAQSPPLAIYWSAMSRTLTVGVWSMLILCGVVLATSVFSFRFFRTRAARRRARR